jgi:cob(I)alamin adenosyltransferase
MNSAISTIHVFFALQLLVREMPNGKDRQEGAVLAREVFNLSSQGSPAPLVPSAVSLGVLPSSRQHPISFVARNRLWQNLRIMRITKVYTRTGDKGETGLVGNRRVPKDSRRIEAYGIVDELNAILGVARASNQKFSPHLAPEARLEKELKKIQNELFVVGSDLATRVEDRWNNMPLVEQRHIDALESLMDELEKELKPLEEFILPGGGIVAAQLHHARTVCRRAERACLALRREEPIGDYLIPYLNRLGDALFVLARWIARCEGEAESMWEREK